MFLSFRAAVLLAAGRRELSLRGARAAGVRGNYARAVRAGPSRRRLSAPMAGRGGERGPPASIYSFNQCECLPLAGVHARVMR